jgi:hypothetical protein
MPLRSDSVAQDTPASKQEKRPDRVFNIRQVAVLGAGRMGARIAAHIANAGFPVLLLDMVPEKGDRNSLAAQALNNLKSAKPAAFAVPSIAERISVGNFEDDLHKVRDCDWVIEAVAEISRSSATCSVRSLRISVPKPSLQRIPAVCRSLRSALNFPRRYGGAGLEPTSSIRRAICACSRSSRRRIRIRPPWLRSQSLAIVSWEKQSCPRGAKGSLREGIRYARERVAFGKPITSFVLVQEKIAEGAAGIYATEAVLYRVVGAIDAALAELDKNSPTFSAEVQKRIEEFAVECSILKFFGSEMVERVVDNTLQMHGGYGYVEEYPAERAYRDSRINTIFEGTNEINRLITTGWMIKRALQGTLPVLPAIKKVMDEVMAGPAAKVSYDGRWRRSVGCWQAPRRFPYSAPVRLRRSLVTISANNKR